MIHNRTRGCCARTAHVWLLLSVTKLNKHYITKYWARPSWRSSTSSGRKHDSCWLDSLCQKYKKCSEFHYWTSNFSKSGCCVGISVFFYTKLPLLTQLHICKMQRKAIKIFNLTINVETFCFFYQICSYGRKRLQFIIFVTYMLP